MFGRQNIQGIPTPLLYLATGVNPTEGTFTPEFTFGTPGDLGVSYGARDGKWWKLGNLVFVDVEITFTPTYTSATGFCEFSLPFNVGNPAYLSAMIVSSSVVWPTDSTFPLMLASLPAKGVLVGGGPTVGQLSFQETAFPSGGTYTVRFSGLYIAS